MRKGKTLPFTSDMICLHFGVFIMGNVQNNRGVKRATVLAP